MDVITHDGAYRVEMVHCARANCGASYPRQYMVGDLCPWCATKRIAQLEARNQKLERLFQLRADANRPGEKHIDTIVYAAAEAERLAYEQGKRIAALEAQLASAQNEVAEQAEYITREQARYDNDYAACEREWRAALRENESLKAQLAQAREALKRYAPSDGDPRSTDELMNEFASRIDGSFGFYTLYGDPHVFLGWDFDQEGCPQQEINASTRRAALLAALKERGQ